MMAGGFGEALVTPHNEAEKDDYAATVLLPGDPQRAEWIAESFLEDMRCVNRRRGALGFTGTFRGHPVSVQSTGIGASSFLIHAHELLDCYGVGTLIRVGSCGALAADVKLRSVVISELARGENAVSGQVFGLYDEAHSRPDPGLLARAVARAGNLGIDHRIGPTVSSDIFYHPRGRRRFAEARASGALAVDMETSALFRIAAHFGARALSICTVVDNIVTGEETAYRERQTLFTAMARLALDVAAGDRAA